LPASDRGRVGVVLVLAAGRGRRMGVPKALMRIGGRAWWHVQSERIAAAGREACWVVSPDVRIELGSEPGAPAPLLESDPDAPMFASIIRGILGLRAASPPWVHVLPVDVPAPRRQTLDALESAAGNEGVAVPVYKGRAGHPACLSWGWVEATLLHRGAEPGSPRLDALLGTSRNLAAVDDPDVCVNLNTPDQAREWSGRQARL
jgi:CTP:molybdopterin cytidylyltransferase MocA